MAREKASQARKGITEAKAKIDRLVNEVIAFRRQITPGKITTVLTRCGKKGCKCQRGDKHLSNFLYVSRGGPLKRLYVPDKDLTWVTERSERYRRLRSCRAELGKAFQALLAQVDELEQALTDPYAKKRAS